MRLFIAIFPPPDVQYGIHLSVSSRKNLYKFQKFHKFRFTRPRNIHLTLKFLGDVPDDTPAAISPALRRSARTHSPFRLRPESLGGFPSSGRARVLWMGASGDLEALSALQRTVEEASEECGFAPDERGFVPHFTVGRSRRPERISGFGSDPAAEFEVNEMHLVESLPSEEGVVYRTVETYRMESRE